MNTYRKPMLILSALLALALLLASVPRALADGSFQAVVAVDSMSVYARKAPHKYLGALPKGTVVTVRAYSGSAALISYGGRTGIAQVSDLSAYTGSAADQTQESDSAGTEVVATRDTRIYKKASTSSRYATVKAGTAMRLLAVNGNCARVSRNGKIGYVVYSHLGEPGSVALTEAQAGAGKSETASVQTGNTPVITAQSVHVYASADGSGDYITVGKGEKLTLLAVKGDCAMVSRNGSIGYTAVSGLQSEASAARAAAARPSGNPFAADSDQHAIYAFLTGELGYNRAAAMGVMANIKYESSYNPTTSGDRGTSYGICQWHAGRKTNLISYCSENGLDYTTLEAQLKFMKYELTTRYPSVHSYMKQVENSADGAYDAGYYFCFNYESPAARTSQSTARGNYARDTLYAM